MEIDIFNTLLIVEDDVDLLDLLAEVAKKHFKTVHTAESAEQAFEFVQQLPPDLIMVDVKMPGMSGVDFVAQLRAKGFATPVIICSAMAGITDLKRALALGVCDFIEKPFTDEIIETVLFRVIEIQEKWSRLHRIPLDARPQSEEARKLEKHISMHQAASAMRLSQ